MSKPRKESSQTKFVQVPVTTEVIEKNADLQPNGKVEANRVIIEFDTRKRDYHQLFKLKRNVQINWSNERTFEVQELSAFSWPLVYRSSTADGYSSSAPPSTGQFHSASAWALYQTQGLGCGFATGRLLMQHRRVGRAPSQLVAARLVSIDGFQIGARALAEVADALPSEDEMLKLLQQQKPITQGHFDELFPLGTEACVLVLKDEHGRSVAAQAVAKRAEEHARALAGTAQPARTQAHDVLH